MSHHAIEDGFQTGGGDHVANEPLQRRTRSLLIVETEALMRWSLATYLSKWFEVFPTDSAAAAHRVLDDRAVHGLIVSDDLSPRSIDELDDHLRAGNASSVLVCMIANVDPRRATHPDRSYLEKPFELHALVHVLGVTEPPSAGSALPK